MSPATIIIARLTLVRTFRGRTWIVALLLMLFPLLIAALARRPEPVFALLLKMPLLLATAVMLAPALADELESKTHTYLWSRPVSRTALLYGKLLALAPPIMVGFAASAVGVWLIVGGDDPTVLARTLGAIALTTLAAGGFAVGAGAIFTRRPLVVVLAYLLIGESLLQFVPLLQKLSLAYYAWGVAGLTPPGSSRQLLEPVSGPGAALGLLILGGSWLALGAWRVTRGEYATTDQ
jgi:ABC-type Na+ efflux pump permease subunit